MVFTRNLVDLKHQASLSCLQTSNQEEVFEQFCKQYFPDRLTDRFKEEGYCAYFLLGAAFVFSVDILEGIEE